MVDPKGIEFSKENVIYIPCHNCEASVESVLVSIPRHLIDQIQCLVVDNCSFDRTSQIVADFIKQCDVSLDIVLVKTHQNIGYAGSQKLAYQLALESTKVKRVLMLHGDGQYPAELVPSFLADSNSDCSVVTGFRDRKTYPDQEETPWLQRTVIRLMNLIENFATGLQYKEWHSGFVMYTTDFLRQVPFGFISNTYHMDGEMLLMANVLKAKVKAIPIYKRYDKHQKMIFWSRVKYVFTVLSLMRRYSKKKLKKIAWDSDSYKTCYEYNVIASNPISLIIS